jgi:threonylcarbamoyladenosine tRNA methylthiotransferase MtaB
MGTFHLLNFGCRASQADGAGIKAQLLTAGLEESERLEESQFAILNTCTVTASADAEVRQVIRRIHRANPACKVLVTGCYAQRAPEEIAALEGVAWVVGNSHKHAIGNLLSTASGGGAPLASEGPGPALHQIQHAPQAAEDRPSEVWVGEITADFHFSPASADDRSRPTLKVQDGCDARCAFCIIPTVRGASRSLPPDTVIEEIRRLEGAGYPEVVLSGINLGRYGRDLTPPWTFLALIERILEETSLRRLRISSIEPMDVSRGLIALAAGDLRLARHFHIPLQSGSDRILRRMSRRYWERQYAERILEIHERIPNVALGADVMVGFPGESESDHAESLRFIESLPFTYLHVFPYSSRPGTRAAQMPQPVPKTVAQRRSREIREVVAKKREAFLAAQIGRSLSVVTLDDCVAGARLALSSNYLKVALPHSSSLPRELSTARITRSFGGILYGYPESRS